MTAATPSSNRTTGTAVDTATDTDTDTDTDTAADTAAGPATQADTHEVLSWAGFGVASRQLAETVHADGYRPDRILCVARGGLFVAGALGYALEVKSQHVMNVEFYTGVDERLAEPVVLAPRPDWDDLRGMRVLVADDVADTGATLELVGEMCRAHACEVRFAVIYEKPRSTVRCEYVWRETDRWIDFPWSSKPPVTAG